MPSPCNSIGPDSIYSASRMAPQYIPGYWSECETNQAKRELTLSEKLDKLSDGTIIPDDTVLYGPTMLRNLADSLERVPNFDHNTVVSVVVGKFGDVVASTHDVNTAIAQLNAGADWLDDTFN